MTWWNRYFFGDVTAHRARLLGIGFLILLALDVWANMFVRAGRYGVEGFNVTHFAWLDAVLPVPTPGFYLGTITIASAGAFVAAFTSLTLRPVLIAALTINLGWSMSLLDSYQHHYLLGLLTLCVLGFTRRADSTQTRTWGFPLVCTVMSVVYLFAAVSKLDAVWRNGDVIQRIAGVRAQPLLEMWATHGGTPDQFWTVAAHSIVLAELFLAGAYLVAPVADRGHRAARVVCTIGLFGAIGFHAAVEWVDLSIEWFSYYLFFLAVMCLGPAKLFDVVGERLEKLGTSIGDRAASWLIPPERYAMMGVLSILVTLVAALLVDLPGVTGVWTAAAAAMLVLVLVGRTVDARARAMRLLVACGVCAITMLAVVEMADTRYHYYRYVGGDALRRAQQHTTLADRRPLLEDALDAYVKANQYAPEDEDRTAKERDVRALLTQLPPATSMKR